MVNGMKNIDITPQEVPTPLPEVHKPRLRFDLDSQQWTPAAAQIRQPLTPQEREAKAKEFDRAAKEATRASDAYKKAQINAKPPEFRAALRAEYRAEVAAKEAARAAALLRETDQQREERENLEGLAKELRRTCPHCRRGREILLSQRNNGLIRKVLALKM